MSQPCYDCEKTNPKTVPYAPTPPGQSGNCYQDCNTQFITVGVSGGSGGKLINLLAGTPDVDILTERLQSEDNFTISILQYTAPTISLSITSPTGIQPKGSTVADVSLAWSYNKAITSQQVFRNGIEIPSPPIVALPNNSYTLDLTGENITANTSYKVEGTDGTTNVSQTKSVTFGNYIFWAEDVIKDAASPDQDVIDIIEAGNVHGIFATRATGNNYIEPQSSDPNDYFYIAIASEDDDLLILEEDKFYEHDGGDKGGGMFLIKQDLSINTGIANVNYNIYRGLFGAQAQAKFEIL